LDYVCNVVGTLKIREINLEISYMEIIDLSFDDFKASPRLREAMRNKEILLYDSGKFPKAKKIKLRNKVEFVKVKDNSEKDYTEIKESLNRVADKLELLTDKLDKILIGGHNYVSPTVAKNATVEKENNITFDDVPIYIPRLDNNFETNIKTESKVSEGTNNILEKLKNLKK